MNILRRTNSFLKKCGAANLVLRWNVPKCSSRDVKGRNRNLVPVSSLKTLVEPSSHPLFAKAIIRLEILRNFCYTVVPFLFLFTPAFSQQSLNPAGGNAIGTTGSVSYTIGQIDYTYHQSSNGSSHLGVQHPTEILRLAPTTYLPCLIYPNPATQSVNLSVQDPDFKTFGFELFDPMGRIHQKGTDMDVTDNIPLDGLVPGIYIITIKNNLNQIWNCRLIKTAP